MDSQNKVLEEVSNKVLVAVTADFNPVEFYKDREGLWVWNSFKERVVVKAEKIATDTRFEVQSFKLTEAANDEAIENSLPKDHLFSETEVCGVVATLINQQPKGKEGVLLNDGNWNLFYTPAFVVGVDWSAGRGYWGVSAWRRGGSEWGSSGRVFSPVTVL